MKVRFLHSPRHNSIFHPKVKIFDFGLAKFMPESGDPYMDVFEMSGAGTPRLVETLCCNIDRFMMRTNTSTFRRYMAPELLNKEAYNMKADVYTFSLVMWQILTGSIPYGFVKSKRHLIHQIVVEKVRPTIDDRWPDSIQGMLESSFDSEMGKRPVSFYASRLNVH